MPLPTLEPTKHTPMLKHLVTEAFLSGGIELYMPQAAPSTARLFKMVHTFARKMRRVITAASLAYAFVLIGVALTDSATHTSLLRPVGLVTGVAVYAYAAFLWLRFYMRTRLIYYLLGEHWGWTTGLVMLPLIGIFVESLRFWVSFPWLVLVVFGDISSSWRARRLASEIRANRGQWDVLSSTSLKEIALGRFARTERTHFVQRV